VAVVVQVPLNTMIADLDETLRGLLRRELAGQGFDGMDIAFDAPSRDWAAQLSVPTVDLFLYDVRESDDHRLADWETHGGAGRSADVRPPMRLDLSYAVSVWTREVEDEHRLLSQVIAILYAHPVLPAEALVGGLADPVAQPYPLQTLVGRPRKEGGPEFWTALGATYKASVDFRVTASVASGTRRERGPEVRTPTVRIRDVDAARGRAEQWSRLGGRVVDAEGRPIADAWVLVSEGRGLALTDAAGRFVLDRVPPGPHAVRVRAMGHEEATVQVDVPSAPSEIVLAAPSRARRRGGGGTPR